MTTRLFNLRYIFFKALAKVPALLEKSPASPGAFGTSICVASPLPLLVRSLRDACALRAFPPLGAFLSFAFWGDSDCFSRGSVGEAVDGAHWPVSGSQPRRRPPCRACRLLPTPKALPCPRLRFYLKRLQMAKVRRAKRASDCRLL